MREFIVLVVLFASVNAAHGQQQPQDVVTLQAEASREVENDQLVAVLAAEAQGANPAELAETVNRRMAQALKAAREVPGVKPRSGTYQTFPRYGKDRRIEAWNVSQELRLEATDIAAAARLIGRLQNELNLRSMSLRLSPEARRGIEDSLISEAIAAFQSRAEIARKAMKASAYRVRELHIATAGGGVPRPLMYAERSLAAAAAPVAVEAGTSQVTVTASGSIQLQ